MKGKSTFTKAEADEIMLLIKKKVRAGATEQKGIRNKIRKIGFFASDYGFVNGYTVEQFLSVAKIIGSPNKITVSEPIQNIIIPTKSSVSIAKPRSLSDESYIIDLCDEVLNKKAIRQHRFDYLRGDSGIQLPVDAFYPLLNLVVEFKEKQHTEKVAFFDKRQTISGVGRGEQRRIYDQRRRDILPMNGIKLIEFDYSEFEHTRSKKLLRNKSDDLIVIKRKLNNYP